MSHRVGSSRKTRARRLTITLLSAALLGVSPGGQVRAAQAASAGAFLDTSHSVHWASIEAIAAAGITKGCNPPVNDRYCPEGLVSRAQMATFLVRALHLPAAHHDAFIDDVASVHEQDINALAQAGITKGCNPPANDRYCPDDSVTRAQMATFLVRGFGLEAAPHDHFLDDQDSLFEQDINALAQAGITKGCNPPANDRYCPDHFVTRAEMATFLARALELPLPAHMDHVGPPVHVDAAPALLAAYHVIREGEPSFRDQVYRPRQFAAGLQVGTDSQSWIVDQTGPYQGWDVLSHTPDELRFTLHRPAWVGVVWDPTEDRPAWLSGWEESGEVVLSGSRYVVLETSLSAGGHQLGNYRAGIPHLLLLAEADGSPSPAPAVPGGLAVPQPNQYCPAWVHDRYATLGPDGSWYPTWHPQIDPVYWCYFGHDHGSDPSLIPGAPRAPYGYVGMQHDHQEAHAGFKEFTFQDLSGTYWVRFVVHGGTAVHGRICGQFHTGQVQVYDSQGRERFSVGLEIDYGPALEVGTLEPLHPTVCGYDMAQLAEDSPHNRRRTLRVEPSQTTQYEVWTSAADSEATLFLGMEFRHLFSVHNPMTSCADQICDILYAFDPKGHSGTRRTIEMRGFEFDAGLAGRSGEFFTDPFVTKVLTSSDPGAVRQYIEPGFSLAFPSDTECYTMDAWRMAYTCITEDTPSIPNMNLEASIVPPN